MKITDLLKVESIDLQAEVVDKRGAVNRLVDLMEKSGCLKDKEAYKAAVLKREGEGSTGIGEGIAIPHAKTDAVVKPALASMIVRTGVDYESLDDEPAHLFFMIAAPADGADVHLEVLSRLSRMLMDDDFREALMSAPDRETYLKIIDNAEQALAVEDSGEAGQAAVSADVTERPFVVAVTACPTGIAHTYMAAEALENKGSDMGIDIKVETNGSGGVKNALTADDIKRAVGVIVAADKDVPVERFKGKHVAFVKVAEGIKNPAGLIEGALQQTAPVFNGSGSKSEESTSGEGTESTG